MTMGRRRNMPAVTALAVAVCLVLICVQNSSSLRCYQCATTDQDHKCRTDYMGFVNDSIGLTDTYIKDCTSQNPDWDRCMIETLEQDGVIKHFHRGCHDGTTFGQDFDNVRFKNLSGSTNSTTCARVKILACYTFCQTDLCNGPQPPPNETDPCADYEYDYYDQNPDGVYCGDAAYHGAGSWSSLMLVCLIGFGVLPRLV